MGEGVIQLEKRRGKFFFCCGLGLREEIEWSVGLCSILVTLFLFFFICLEPPVLSLGMRFTSHNSHPGYDFLCRTVWLGVAGHIPRYTVTRGLCISSQLFFDFFFKSSVDEPVLRICSPRKRFDWGLSIAPFVVSFFLF